MIKGNDQMISSPNPKAEKKTYDLNFGGLPFKLRSSHDESTVFELAQYVDNKMHQSLSAVRSGSYQNAAVLAALNIAEELILLKKTAWKELDQLERKLKTLSDQIENSKPQKNKTENSSVI